MFPVSAVAQSPVVEAPNELTPPRHEPKYPEVPNVHEVEMVWPKVTPLIKDRKEVPEAERKPADQNYQVACQHGDISRCAGVDLQTLESEIRVKKPQLSVIKKPVIKIKLVSEEHQKKGDKKKR